MADSIGVSAIPAFFVLQKVKPVQLKDSSGALDKLAFIKRILLSIAVAALFWVAAINSLAAKHTFGNKNREAAVNYGVRQALGIDVNADQEEIDRAIVAGIQDRMPEINSSLPKMVDEYTRMDSADLGPGKLITYSYTFPELSLNQLRESDLSTVLETEVRNNVCSNEGMRPSIDLGVVYKYVYHAEFGKEFFAFTVDKPGCVLDEIIRETS